MTIPKENTYRDLNSVILSINHEDFVNVQASLKALTSQKNAYTEIYAAPHMPSPQPWNMITYKKDCKSTL